MGDLIGGIVGGLTGGNPLDMLADSQNQALQQTAAMNAMQAQFDLQMEGLKAVSESLSAGHQAKMDALDKVGQAAR
jgi:hypothetical protein